MRFFKDIFDSKLFKSAGVYTIANSLNSLIPFLLMPILTRYLSPEDYGLVSMFSVMVFFIKPFIGLNSDAAFKRQWFEQEKIDIRLFASNCYVIFILSSLIMFGIIMIFSKQISIYTSFPAEYLWTTIIYAICNYITNFILVVWQVKNQPVKYSTFKILLTLLNAGISILFVAFLNLGWEGRINAQLYSIVFFAIIALWILYKNRLFVFKINRDYISHALKYGVPLLPHTLSTILITLTDRIFITNMVDIGTTGIYVIGYKVGSIISILSLSFDHAYGPWIYAKLKLNDLNINKKIVRFTYLYFLGIIILALSLGITAPWFLNFYIGQEFKDSSIFVIWVSLGYSFNGMYLVVSKYIFYSYKTYMLSWVSIITAGINVILNYIFIQYFGALGAAYATTLTYFLKFILVWSIAAIVYEMPWNLNKSDLPKLK